ncbi:MAG: hypothetical protein GY937_14290 [bacterium]|nr:hypothetical protein [bacterium]
MQLDEDQSGLLGKFNHEIEEAHERLSGLVSSHDPWDFMVALGMRNYLVDPETYREATFEGRSAFAEHFAYLCGAETQTGGSQPLTESVLDQAQTALQELFSAHLLLEGIDSSFAEDPDLAALSRDVATDELLVRAPGYPHHLHELLTGLFAPFDEVLVQRLGFGTSDVLLVFAGWRRLCSRRIAARRKLAREEVEVALKHIEDGAAPTPDLQRVVDRLGSVPREHRAAAISDVYSELVYRGFGDTCSATPADIADEASLTPGVARAVLSRFALQFSDLPAPNTRPAPFHPLKLRPFVEANGRFACPAPALLDWSVQAQVEDFLKGDGKLWNRYAKHRHDFVLSRGAELLGEVVAGATIERNLFYQPDAAKPDIAEVDALVLRDSTLIIIEAKGAGISVRARQGRADRLERHLKEIVGGAHAQAMRADRYISGRLATFRRADGTEIAVDGRRVREVFWVALTLAPIGHMAAHINSQRDPMELAAHRWPWIVSILDLFPVRDLLEIPAMLPHYISRRLQVAHQGLVVAHDELDFLGCYLSSGLYFNPAAPDVPTQIILGSFTDEIDAYYMHEQGQRRSPSPIPRQNLGPEFRRLLEAIEASGLHDRLTVSMALLDLSGEARAGFMKLVFRARKKARKRQRGDATVIGGELGDRWGITYFCGRDGRQMNSGLFDYCMVKKYQARATRWVGLADIGTGNSFHLSDVLAIEAEWQYDPELESAAAALPSSRKL